MMFSIVIPTRNRTDELQRCLLSLKTQTYGDFECIVVDDFSDKERNGQIIVHWLRDRRFTCIRLEEHSERCIARNTGFNAAQGEWFLTIDSDDELASHTLEVVAQATEDYKDAKCFNYGSIVFHRHRYADGPRYTGVSLRPPFMPRWNGESHEEFKAGKICQGSYVFHRDVWDAIGPLPAAKSPYKVHELATDVHHLYPYPPRKGVDTHGSLGNPWG